MKLKEEEQKQESSKNRKSAKTFWSFINFKSNLKIWKTLKFWNLGKFWKFLKLWKVCYYGNSRHSAGMRGPRVWEVPGYERSSVMRGSQVWEVPKYAKGDKCPKKHYLGSLQKTMPQAAGEIIIKKIFLRPEVPEAPSPRGQKSPRLNRTKKSQDPPFHPSEDHAASGW